MLLASRAFPEHLSRAGMNLLNDLQKIAARITFLPLQPTSVKELEAYMRTHDKSELIILDQKIEGIEKIGVRKNWGYLYESNGLTIKVIDHHVNDAEFQDISTGNLAIRYLESEAPPDKDALICLTHKDCDSLLASMIISGALPPDKAFGDAVLAADHSAEKNVIADLLQAIEDCPKAGQTVQPDQFTYSLKALGALLTNRRMDDSAKALLDAREKARSSWESRLGDFIEGRNGTFTYVCPERVTSDPCPEFLTSLLPNAQIILVFHNSPSEPDFMQIRAVRGLAAQKGVAIDHPNIIKPVVPGFGGRADAGSNRRSGISVENPLKIAEEIDLNLGRVLRG